MKTVKILSRWIYGQEQQGQTLELPDEIIAELDKMKVKYEIVSKNEKTKPGEQNT